MKRKRWKSKTTTADYFICIEKIEYVYLLLISSISSNLDVEKFERHFVFFSLFKFTIPLCRTSLTHPMKMHGLLYGTRNKCDRDGALLFCWVSFPLKWKWHTQTHWIFGYFFPRSLAKTIFHFRWKYAIRTVSNMMGITFHRRVKCFTVLLFFSSRKHQKVPWKVQICTHTRMCGNLVKCEQAFVCVCCLYISLNI